MITVLLAEDNQSVAASIRRYLEYSDFEVMHVKNGEDAVQIALEQKPNIILMDIQMPGCGGLEAIKRIRAEPSIADIPIIAATGLDSQHEGERCLKAGANRFIGKPYRIKEMVEYIHELCGQNIEN